MHLHNSVFHEIPTIKMYQELIVISFYEVYSSEEQFD